MSEPMRLDPATLAVIVARTRREVLAELKRSRLAPAKVAGVGMRDDGLPTVQVIIEGDSADNPTEITPVTPVNPVSLSVGDPVMVGFDHPAGVYLAGRRGYVSPEGARPYASRVVAASNSIATGATQADLVCDGTDDGATIMEAVLEVANDPDFDGPGGKVLLLEGMYLIEPDVLEIFGNLDPWGGYVEGVHLQGMGPGTVLQAQSSPGTLVAVYNGGVVSDLAVIWSTDADGLTGVNVYNYGTVRNVVVAELNMGS